MSSFYEMIGRLVVGFVMRRYGREIRIAGAAGLILAALAAAGWAATREDPEDS
jgi:hypothetical protein